jgi:3-deoxy-D-manno-octulosonate 8-phosphate phosphatase KdsC-like HAD superfamily phosphatase
MLRSGDCRATEAGTGSEATSGSGARGRRTLHSGDCRALDAETTRWVYVGDSTNDQVMFEHFACSVGVANIRRFEDQLTHRPRYITPSERGAGFAELTRHLLTHLN